MLEQIVIYLGDQTEDTLRLIVLGLMGVGAIIAAIVTRSTLEIARAPYFAYRAFIFFAICAAQIVWLWKVDAIVGGYVWLLPIVGLGAFMVGGFYTCEIAIARSRDAYGHGRMAFLAFVPIANLVLLLKPSKNPASTNRVSTPALMSRGFGVLTGFVLYVAGGALLSYLDYQVSHMLDEAQTDPAAQQAIVEYQIHSRGLAQALQTMAAEVQTPIRIDDVTDIIRIKAEGTLLRRTLMVDLDGFALTEEFITLIRNDVCAYPGFAPVLRAGGAIIESYVEPSGREIGSVVVTSDECGD